MKTKDVEIEYNGKKEIVRLKKLSYGEKNLLSEECTTIKVVGNQPLVQVSSSKMMEIALLKSIVDAPFPNTIQNIRDLDAEVGEKLFAEFQEVNNMIPKKSEN